MSGLLHIASLVVQHRPERAAALDACLAALPGAEVALRDGGRSIVLCEAESESALMAVVDALQALDGVYAVNLVHHHAESAASLDEEIQP